MARLKDRNKFIPGGFRFTQPQVPRWSVTPWSSFDRCVAQIIEMRLGNPHVTATNHLATDYYGVANELDDFNARICAEMGWRDYITEGGQSSEAPKSNSPQSFLQRGAAAVGKVSSGVQTIREWEIAGLNVVSQEKAESRAKVCVRCPRNVGGDLTSWFTVPAAKLIHEQIESKNNMKLRTSVDPLLSVCEVCACPLKVKVWAPIEIVHSKLTPEVKSGLVDYCWILTEEQKP